MRVLPTREDCIGLVLLEVLFAGIPIVSSKDADRAYDIIQPEVNGIIVDPFNAAEFASAIERVMKEKRYTENASKMDVSKFSYENFGGVLQMQYAL